MVPSMVNDLYIIRFAVCAKHATDDDMRVAFIIIRDHADVVLAEHSAQRAGRQSSSTDSLDLLPKSTTTTNELETTVAEEVVHPEVLPENASGPTIYPLTKARVRNEFSLFFRRIFILSFSSGEHNYNDNATSSCDI